MRPVNKCLFKACNTTCCTSCRPGDQTSKDLKSYDATLIFSEFDEEWIDTKLLPSLSKGKSFKIHKLTSYHKGFDVVEKDQLEIMRSSKRIVLVFSKNFLKEEWKCESLVKEVKLICAKDPDCVIIPINMDLDKNDMATINLNLEEHNESSCYNLKQLLRYSMILRRVEPLHNNKVNFAQNFNFLMPIKKKLRNTKVISTIITDSSSIKNNARMAIQSPSTIKIESEVDSDVRENRPFVSKKRNKKTRRVVPAEYNEPKPITTTLPPITTYRSDSDSAFDYSFNSSASKPRNFDFDNSDISYQSSIRKPEAKKNISSGKNLPFIREESSREGFNKMINDPYDVPISILPRFVLFGNNSDTGVNKINLSLPKPVNALEDTNFMIHENTIQMINRNRLEIKPNIMPLRPHNTASEQLRPPRDERIDYSTDSPLTRTKKNKKKRENVDNDVVIRSIEKRKREKSKPREELSSNQREKTFIHDES